MVLKVNRIIQGDCVEALRRLPADSVHLVFADPPFNIGYAYDEYDDNKSTEEYLSWSKKWMAEVVRVLRPDGTFWLAIGDEYAAELKVTATRELGLSCRNWVVWYYTFGVHCNAKFTRSHAHLLYFVRDPRHCTFNADRLRVPSARQLVYADKRANPKGRLPDDTWIMRPTPEDSWILRPQDLPDGFAADGDTWYLPRVCGTFKERGGFHGCQMPEQLLGRIILGCSNEGDVVLDPFVGTGTTLAVAKKLGRCYLGTEISGEYVANARERLRQARRGDSLAGSREPTRSAPSTLAKLAGGADGRQVRGKTGKLNGVKATALQVEHKHVQLRRVRGLDDLSRGIVEAFRRAHQGLSSDRVIADPELNEGFVAACKGLGLEGRPVDWNLALLRLRKASCLSHLRPMRPTRLDVNDLDQFEFGSEGALAVMAEKYEQVALDRLLCDPESASEFDVTAQRFAPGGTPLYYRWAALRFRKRQRRAVRRAHTLRAPITLFSFGEGSPLEAGLGELTDSSALYLLQGESQGPLYVGATTNLRRRLNVHVRANIYGDASICPEGIEQIMVSLPQNWPQVHAQLAQESHGELCAIQSSQITRLSPAWNLPELGTSRRDARKGS